MPRLTQNAIEPLGRCQMKGIGYRPPSWTHGMFKGELVVERESFVIAALDPLGSTLI